MNRTPVIQRPDFLTRWQIRLLWLGWAWPFNWAHHPLCNRFRSDVLRVGRLHLCRSCTIAWSGIVGSAVLLAMFWTQVQTYLPLLFMSLAVPTITLSMPGIYKRLPRLMRDLLRLGMGVLIAMTGAMLIGSFWMPEMRLIAWGGAAVIVAFWRLYFRLRRGRRLRSCDDCAELHAEGVCTGYAMQAERIRRYEEAATELVECQHCDMQR